MGKRLPGQFGGRFTTGDFRLERWGRLEKTGQSDAKNLYLDFDFTRAPKVRPILAVLRITDIRASWIEYIRTRRGWHITVRVRDELEPSYTVALQALMGSDNRRECLNLRRVRGMAHKRASKFWKKRWNILFSGKLKP